MRRTNGKRISSRNPERLHNNPSTGDNRSPEIQLGSLSILLPGSAALWTAPLMVPSVCLTYLEMTIPYEWIDRFCRDVEVFRSWLGSLLAGEEPFPAACSSLHFLVRPAPSYRGRLSPNP